MSQDVCPHCLLPGCTREHRPCSPGRREREDRELIDSLFAEFDRRIQELNQSIQARDPDDRARARRLAALRPQLERRAQENPQRFAADIRACWEDIFG